MTTFSRDAGDRGRFYYRAPDPQAGERIRYVVWADLEKMEYEEYRIDQRMPQEVGNPTFLLNAAGTPFRFRTRRPFIFFKEVIEE